MYKVRNISSLIVMNRAGISYLRRVPADLKKHYSVKRLCFSLRTSPIVSNADCIISASGLEDYWLGLRLRQMDIPAIHLVRTDDVEDASLL